MEAHKEISCGSGWDFSGMVGHQLLQSCDPFPRHHTITPITSIVTIWSCSIMWPFPITCLSAYAPDSYPWPRYTVLHSCGTLQQTCVPAFVHSSHMELYFLYLPCIISTLILCPHAFPSHYVPLRMFHVYFPHHSLNIPDAIMRPNLIRLVFNLLVSTPCTLVQILSITLPCLFSSLIHPHWVP
jgi:hypothetical protein